jgi:hypothetical protein
MWLAYKYVAVAAMLAEASFCSHNLKLPIKLPIERSQLRYRLVGTPELPSLRGRLDTDDYSFCFPRSGRLQFIHRLARLSPPDAGERNRTALRPTSLISTNEAYRLATNWLTALSFDVHALERSNECVVWQEVLWDENGREKGHRPIFHVDWGPRTHLKVEISRVSWAKCG